MTPFVNYAGPGTYLISATDSVKNAKKGRWDVVRQYHFPIEPGERAVRRNSPTARRAAEQAESLEQLGSGLHILQDSYSHEMAYVGSLDDQIQRYPDNLRLKAMAAALDDEEQGIFHPDRPEIGSRADTVTTDEAFRDPDRALEMAKASFYLLLDYRLRLAEIDTAERAALEERWERVEPIVREFAMAKTKGQKSEWAKRYAGTIETAEEDIDSLSLPKD